LAPRKHRPKLTQPAQIAQALRVVRQHGIGQVRFWFIALLVGVLAGSAALGFRLGISGLQAWIYGADDVMLASAARDLPWYVVLTAPILGGLVVGLILTKFTPDGRAHTVADVIVGSALRDGRVDGRAGLASALASLITLSTGGSTGREGPVVHLGAVISSKFSKIINADGITGRDLMGCAVAAAVSASFNAPIAGALFAMEVVLRHFAVRAFAPITIAAVAGTVVSRLEFGNITEFTLPPHSPEFYVELPAFLLLGLVCGLVAVIMMRSILFAEDVGNRIQAATGLPGFLRPAVAGAILGLLAIWFPHIIGVGYETTSLALTGNLLFWNAVVFAMVKVFAVAVTFGGRMGGGVFSPSMMTGALTGLAFGWVATSLFPAIEGDETLYALAGTGAVAAAVLGAPISTILIVFEMTGDWQAGLAVMVAVSMSSALASRLVHRSFFLTQLEKRNVHLAEGPQAYLLSLFSAGDLMRPISEAKESRRKRCDKLIAADQFLYSDATLESAMPMFESLGRKYLPVIRRRNGEKEQPELVGTLHVVDALKAVNRALAETAKEEHS
jgi:CIC family chloride channel protein